MDAVVSLPTVVAPGVATSLNSTEPLPQLPWPLPAVMNIEFLDSLLRFCFDNKCSDVFLTTGDPVAVMWQKSIRFLETRELEYEELAALLDKMYSDPTASMAVNRGEPLDRAYSIEVDRRKYLRFRVNATAHMASGGPGIEITFRGIGDKVESLDALGVEPYIADNCNPSDGLVIVTGVTGTGKSVLLDAMMMKLLLSPQAKRLLTFCAPIEKDLRLIKGRTGQVVQHDIGLPGQGGHVRTWLEAVKNFLRRHPHAVLFGEARDKATIEGVILSCLSGHVTFTTSHASSTHMTIPRMADEFGADRVRISKALCEQIRLVVTQKLLPKQDGLGLVGIRSALNVTRSMRDELLRSSVDQIPILMKEFTEQDGITLIASAEKQWKLGNISQAQLDAVAEEVKTDDPTH